MTVMMNVQRQGIGMTSARTRERLVQRLRNAGIAHDGVLEAIRHTPRHLFIEEAFAHQAYDDTALPIGHGQTISQPWVVARMTALLIEAGEHRNVLEIGTGCGYQTAVLAALVPHVYSLERIRPLQDQARKRLQTLHLANTTLRHADGGMGWSDAAPFSGILVTCARASVPQELLQQLADGGRLVMPIGDDARQHLTVVDRQGDRFITQTLDAVRFVPFRQGVQR